MSYHLTHRDLTEIEAQIRKMRRITWERVHKRVKDRLGLPHSISTLKKNSRVRKAYADRKKDLSIKETADENKLSKIHLPKDPGAYIVELERRESAMLENLKTILGNAVQLGIPVERMELPLEPVSYSPTPRKPR
ncbi:hypothetical protein ACFSUD_16275 [Sulfitobacter aestuarii]|uniref:Uncharacterized protein n=1 Tax=Sulfitobacter aestuarii TaxID=2161676 RepID=A0ABW5U5M9_9RHOB